MLAQQISDVIAEKNIPDYFKWSFDAFTRTADFDGKCVLEVGGSCLPREFIEALNVKNWTSVDILGHSAGAYQQRNFSDHYSSIPVRKLNEIQPDCVDETYVIYDGDITHLPTEICDTFDLAISVNAFEHILNLPLALSKICNSLKWGGQCMTSFGPIWSCAYGSHFWFSNDWNFLNEKQAPVPRHAHLLMSPPELYRLLIAKGKKPDEASTAVSQIYHQDRVNRLFFDDYVAYFAASDFSSHTTKAFHTIEIEERVQQVLETRYPGRTDFETYSALATLTK